ncbi:MAG: LysR family transcriptional regulator, partial [Kordiimonadaceae bacterium]|nr:LysR family transcriptional regulator [Kordiimonadaceae bacterium]
MNNWDDLRYFLEIARCGSITAAAKALGVGNATIMFRHMLPNAMVA